MTRKPSVGRIVHYVSYGTPGGEYPQACRAAVVTDVASGCTDNGHYDCVALAVLNPTGAFFNTHITHHSSDGEPGDPDCPMVQAHGDPFLYCACGWQQKSLHHAGTWHWPEHVTE